MSSLHVNFYHGSATIQIDKYLTPSCPQGRFSVEEHRYEEDEWIGEQSRRLTQLISNQTAHIGPEHISICELTPYHVRSWGG